MTKRLLYALAFLLLSVNILSAQCFPFVTSPGQTNDYITSFTIGSNTFNAGPAEEACDYVITDSNVILQSATAYTFTVTFGATCTNQYVGIWFDLNGDNQFSPPEMIFASTTPGSGTNPVTGTLTIPTGGLPGGTTLRICTKANSPVLSTEFCNMNGAGEYQDYLIYLDSALPCTGTPDIYTIDYISCFAGSNYNVIAKLNNVYKELGYTYQWQTADDIAFTVNTTVIPNSNHPYIFAQIMQGSYLRCDVTCTSSATTISTPAVFMMLQPTTVSNIIQSTSIAVQNTLFTESIVVNTQSKLAEQGTLTLYNTTGQQVLAQSVNLKQGNHTVSIPTSNLANGFYYVQYASASYQGRAIKVLKL